MPSTEGHTNLWDPLGGLPVERRWAWATLAVWLAVFLGPAFVAEFRLGERRAPGRLPDFFQEWASARNVLEGLPVYTHHEIAIDRYLGAEVHLEPNSIILNAHPPTSVLLALPLARFDLGAAFLLWNLASLPCLGLSLWLVQRQLAIPVSAWSIFPMVALLLLCAPLRQQIHQGQLNLVLLPLLTGTWAAERSGRPRLAGALLGAATAVKLFPGVLFVYYVLRRRWSVVGAGILMLAALTGLTVAVLGLDAYRDYVRVVLPEITWFRVGWDNNSLAGFWARLFDPAPERVRPFARSEPIWYSPTLATVATGLSAAIVAALLARAVRRSRTARDQDRTFGLAVVAMLLVSPIAWVHYSVLLLVPLAVFWSRLPPSGPAPWLFAAIVAALWLDQALVWTLTGVGGRVAGPFENLVILPFQSYALVGLFVFGSLEGKGEGPCEPST